jgi:tetratricopeptide (TPR) repeat protein
MRLISGKLISRNLISAATLLLVVMAFAMPGGAVFAQASECGKERKVGVKALDEATYKQLNKAYEYLGEENYDEAYKVLQKVMSRSKRGDYLQAVLNQAMAQVEWSRENFDAALKYFEKAVELNALPNQAHFALMYQIAQLYFMKDRFQAALDKLDLWFCKVPPEKITSSAYVLKASIYIRMENYAEAVKAIDAAIAMDENPKEQWYQLKLASHYELEQYPQAAETLVTIISHWPDKKMYWTQLSQIYLKLKQDEKSLAVMALAYRRNMLDAQGDVLFLSNLYANSNVPYKSAVVLEKGMKDGIVEPTKTHWTVAADAWYAAEEMEKALLAYEKAGEASVDGKIDLRRAYILVDLERWPESLDALNDSLRKGGLSDRKTGEAYLLRGMAQFNLENFDSASSDWGKAGRYERSRKAAQQWMNHMREERLRKAS